jgi:hypothetical protein
MARVDDPAFVALMDAYRPLGGIARSKEVYARAALHGVGDPAVRRWLVGKQLFALDWSGESWIPLFQIERCSFSPKPLIASVLAELGPHWDGWQLATWFSAPNPALGGTVPAALVSVDPVSVLYAARTHRTLRAA